MNSRAIIAVLGKIVLVALLAGTPAWAGELVVIVNKDVRVDSLDRAAVSDIYLGKKTKWDDRAIRVVMLKSGATHERFVEQIVGTTPAKLRNLWKKVLFAGRGRPPKVLKTEEEMIKSVASTSGAIGYIDSSTPHGEAQVISIGP